MSADIEFQARGGGATKGALATPDGSTRAAGVVLIQEYWGVNAHIRALVDRFAGAGYLTLAPDLFDGKIAKNADEAGALMAALDRKQAVERIAGAAAFLKEHPRSTGKVAVVGFCLGGALAFAAGCAVPEIDAVVPFYGIPQEADWSRLKAPVLAHFAAKDDWASADKGAAIRDKVVAGGGRMVLHVYEAGHAFFNDSRPEVYSAESAKLAWSRTMDFLRAELA